MSATMEFVCEECGKQSRQEVGPFAHTLPVLGHVPRDWGYITIHTPAALCPNQVAGPIRAAIKDWYLCSQECLEKVLTRIYQGAEWKDWR